MKIYIGNYRNHWISPDKIFCYMFFWTDWSKCRRWTLKQTLEDESREKTQWVDTPQWVDRWSDRLLPITSAIQWVLDRVHPKIEYVKIDRWDTWSMDHTLAHIVLPMLKQLKATKHGAPFVDDDDVPEHLRSTFAPAKANEWDTDAYHFLRWDWALDEMIFAFEHKIDDSWEDAFCQGKIDWISVPVDKDGNEVVKGEHRYFQMKDGPNHTFQCDYEGIDKVQKRISNGFRLFGKYYEALWD